MTARKLGMTNTRLKSPKCACDLKVLCLQGLGQQILAIFSAI
jgi:hypothetical protein